MKLQSYALAALAFVSLSAWADTAAITVTTPADPRNNFTGTMGFRFTVGGTNIVVSKLGMIKLPANTSPTSHTVKIANATTPFADVAGASVIVTPSGATNDFTYVDLASPVTLTAGASYYLVVSFIDAGDYFADPTDITAAADLTVDQVVYYDGTYHEFGGSNKTMGIPNLIYNLAGTTPPSVAMTAPSNGASISGASVTVSATCTPASGQTITSVQFKRDGTSNVGSADTSSPFSVALDSTALAAGAHTLTALCTQSDSGTATATPVSVTVANPPSASITAPSNGATVSGTITLSASASAVSGRTIASVQFKVDGSNSGSADTSSPFSISLDTTMLSDASHTITAVAVDSTGESVTTASISITVHNVVTVSYLPHNADTKYTGIQDLSTARVIPPNISTTPSGGCANGQSITLIFGTYAIDYVCVGGGWVQKIAGATAAWAVIPQPCLVSGQVMTGQELNGDAICATPTGSGSGASQTSQLTDFATPTRTSATVLTFSSNCLPGQTCNVDIGGTVTPIAGGPYTLTLANSHTGSVCAYFSPTGTLTVGVATALGSDVTASAGVTVVPGVDSCPQDAKKLWTWNVASGAWASSGTPLAAAYSYKPSPISGLGINVTAGSRDTIAVDTGVVLRKFMCVGGPATSLPSGGTLGDICWDMDGAAGSVAGKYVCNRSAGCTVAADWKTY